MSVMLASDANNPNFVGASNPDAALHVEFYKKPVKQPFKAMQEGLPIHETVVYVRIHTPGNQLNIIDTPARDDHKQRFPLQWAHFQNQQKGDEASGVPVTQWPMIDVAMAETLKALKFFTVEQIAFASDEQIAKVGMTAGMNPMQFRERAKSYLQVAKDSAALDRERAEKEEMKKQIEELKALVMGKQAPVIIQPEAPQVEDKPEAPKESEERTNLVSAYTAKFGKPPHHKMKLETIREKVNA